MGLESALSEQAIVQVAREANMNREQRKKRKKDIYRQTLVENPTQPASFSTTSLSGDVDLASAFKARIEDEFPFPYEADVETLELVKKAFLPPPKLDGLSQNKVVSLSFLVRAQERQG